MSGPKDRCIGDFCFVISLFSYSGHKTDRTFVVVAAEVGAVFVAPAHYSIFNRVIFEGVDAGGLKSA